MSGTIVGAGAIGRDLDLEADFVVVGSGAGGGVSAAVLTAAGARVVVLESGGHHTRRDFNMRESWAYPTLYQDHGNRATDDLSIIILQGRSVGGSTTVNWTGIFKPPRSVLDLWANRFGVEGVDEATLAPHLDAVLARLGVGEGNPDDVNANNRVLLDGATKLGWQPKLIRRAVQGCARLGACGLGCPIDAKRSSRTTFIADAVAGGATVYADCHVERIERDGRRVVAVEATVLDPGPDRPSGRRVRVRPRRGVVVAGGAINSPALLLQTGLGRTTGGAVAGRRTFLHPTIPTLALFDQTIAGWSGPPLSVSSHHFAERGDRMGYFFETPPIHPMLAAIAFPAWGPPHRALAQQLAHAQAIIALLIDGHGTGQPAQGPGGDDDGGTVTVDDDGRIHLRYPFSPALVEAARDAIKNNARIQLAAGAREVVTLHSDPLTLRREADLAAVDAAPFGPNLHTVFSAHQMGGNPMGADRARAVVDGRGRHHDLDNLWVCDGSVFPTSTGVNPQLTVYAVARLFATDLARAG